MVKESNEINAGNNQNRKKTDMATRIVSAIVILLMSIILFVGILIVLKHDSPEYALYMTANDIKENGVECLGDHLSNRAKDKIGHMYRNNGVEGIIISMLEGYANEHLSEATLKSYKFTHKNIKSAEAELIIEYKGVNLTVIIYMVKENGRWLIDDVCLPQAITGAAKLISGFID